MENDVSEQHHPDLTNAEYAVLRAAGWRESPLEIYPARFNGPEAGDSFVEARDALARVIERTRATRDGGAA